MSYDGPERRSGNWFTRALRDLGTDPAPTARWHHIWRDFVPLAAIIIAAFAVFSVEGKVDETVVQAQIAKADAQVASRTARTQRQTLAVIQAESKDRRNQSCRVFERLETTAVRRVVTTYKYLDELPRSELVRPTLLTTAILRNLGATYQDAKASRAPPYCDKPDVGLPEPQPKLPKMRRFDG